MDTILVVDDSPLVRVTVARMLESAGYEVVTAAGAQEAIAVVRRGDGRVQPARFDLAVLEAFLDNQREIAEIYDRPVRAGWSGGDAVDRQGATDDNAPPRGRGTEEP